MIDIDIPDEYREAWQWANVFPGGWDYVAQLRDALVWAIAGWAETQWLDSHHCAHNPNWINNYQCDDPRHGWDSDHWREKVRKALEAK